MNPQHEANFDYRTYIWVSTYNHSLLCLSSIMLTVTSLWQSAEDFFYQNEDHNNQLKLLKWPGLCYHILPSLIIASLALCKRHKLPGTNSTQDNPRLDEQQLLQAKFFKQRGKIGGFFAAASPILIVSDAIHGIFYPWGTAVQNAVRAILILTYYLMHITHYLSEDQADRLSYTPTTQTDTPRQKAALLLSLPPFFILALVAAMKPDWVNSSWQPASATLGAAAVLGLTSCLLSTQKAKKVPVLFRAEHFAPPHYYKVALITFASTTLISAIPSVVGQSIEPLLSVLLQPHTLLVLSYALSHLIQSCRPSDTRTAQQPHQDDPLHVLLLSA